MDDERPFCRGREVQQLVGEGGDERITRDGDEATGLAVRRRDKGLMGVVVQGDRLMVVDELDGGEKAAGIVELAHLPVEACGPEELRVDEDRGAADLVLGEGQDFGAGGEIKEGGGAVGIRGKGEAAVGRESDAGEWTAAVGGIAGDGGNGRGHGLLGVPEIEISSSGGGIVPDEDGLRLVEQIEGGFRAVGRIDVGGAPFEEFGEVEFGVFALQAFGGGE